MKRIIILIFYFIALKISAQTFSAQVFDKKTKEPVSFCYAGILNKAVVTVADGDGKFTLQLSDKYDNDSLRITMIGFKPLVMKISELKNKNSGFNKFYLEENTYTLAEITVRPVKYKTEVIGNKDQGQPCVTFIGDTTKGDGIAEVGTHLKIKHPSTFVDNINFSVCRNDFDSITIRINIYDFKTSENLLRKAIYVKVKKDQKKVTVDTKSYNISVDQDIIVAFEALEILQMRGAGNKYKGKVFDFSGGMFGADMLLRKNIYSKWEKVPIAVLGFNATITYAKK